MNGKVIPGTPIAVDFWKIRECPNARLFFLTHLHGDHTVGLSPSWQHKIYCSEITGKLLEERYEIDSSQICLLETGCSHIMYVDSDQIEQMTVTVIDAHHCPGSVMFLFEGYFGKVLYTGDFRFDSKMKDDPLMENLSGTDVVYLDNTYNSPRCVFPSREESQKQIMEIIHSHEEFSVKIGLRNLGKEDLLVAIAQDLQEWIKVSPAFFQVAEILDLPDVFITGETDARIEIVPFYSISNKNIESWNKEHPTIAILPTSLYTGLEMSPFCNQDNVFIVPYSDHSSFDELTDFIKIIKPRCVYPIVNDMTRGPFGISVSDRADVSVFKPFLSSPRRKNPEIPDSVKRWMFGNRTLPLSKPLNKKPLALKRKRSLSLKRGVHFDDSMEDFSEEKTKKKKILNIKGSDDKKSGPEDEYVPSACGQNVGHVADKENSRGENSENSPNEDITNLEKNVVEKLTVKFTRRNESEKSHKASSNTECEQEHEEKEDKEKTGGYLTREKKQSVKSFLLYVLDTDISEMTDENKSENPSEENKSACNGQSKEAGKADKTCDSIQVVPVMSGTEKKSNDKTFNYLQVIPISSKTAKNKKQGKLERGVMPPGSTRRPVFNVKPL
ncbi:5' exonuclease Apollo-like [Saccostrea echinata]|uniref:5' exonuclease Apollo-like n=1 Tax=Saccostrea echinata TaxID=191078 RepID=UPI002A836C6A|nr:5' exonuclease Apollo-like [Saccostrea echinata]